MAKINIFSPVSQSAVKRTFQGPQLLPVELS